MDDVTPKAIVRQVLVHIMALARDRQPIPAQIIAATGVPDPLGEDVAGSSVSAETLDYISEDVARLAAGLVDAPGFLIFATRGADLGGVTVEQHFIPHDGDGLDYDG